MAQDTSYQGANRSLQGGVVKEIGSTGRLDNYGTLNNYGTLAVGSTSTMTMAGTETISGTVSLTGTVTASGNGVYREQTETGTGVSTSSTGAVTLSAYGASLLTTTGTTGASALFRVPKPPAVGQRKIIFCTNASTAKLAIVETTATGIIFGTSNSTSHGTYHRITMNDPEDCVELFGISASAWGVLSNEGSASLTTNFTT